MHYIAYHKLGSIPNIIVDGASNKNTVLNLSHWPLSNTPKELKDDLSVQIVFKYLGKPEYHVKCDVVSNNHFDEDGLVGMYALINPEKALKQKDILIDIGRAGDFGTYKNRNSARIVFVLSAYADPDFSPLNPEIFEKEYSDIAEVLYKHMLELLPDIISSPERFKRFWQYEEEMLNASEAAIWRGDITIEEIPDIDLAIVRIPEAIPGKKVHRFTLERKAVCHPMAVHNSTNCFRVLYIQGHTYELEYRYETWVQYMSKKPLPRVDLTGLAQELTHDEKGKAKWIFDGVNLITPSLHLDGVSESSINPDVFISKVKNFLLNAEPAWNPYD
jgi:hypothetical protein